MTHVIFGYVLIGIKRFVNLHWCDGFSWYPQSSMLPIEEVTYTASVVLMMNIKLLILKLVKREGSWTQLFYLLIHKYIIAG